MKHQLIAILALTLSSVLFADNRGTLIFEDDFSRNESQEATEEIGKGWGPNSKTRAGGKKQVDLKDGTMRIHMHATACVTDTDAAWRIYVAEGVNYRTHETRRPEGDRIKAMRDSRLKSLMLSADQLALTAQNLAGIAA